eukprot:scaffold14589_cov101-Skeletonema_dohrnii-CCMP3373.AAC.1
MFDLFCDLLLDMPDDMFDDDAARDAALDYEDEAQLSGGRHYDEDEEEEEEYVREGTYEGRGFPEAITIRLREHGAFV